MKLLDKIFGKKKTEKNVPNKEEEKFQIGKYEVPENLIWNMYEIDITLARANQSGHFDFLDYRTIYDVEKEKGIIFESTQEFLQIHYKITNDKKETPITINMIKEYISSEKRPLTKYPLRAMNEQEIPRNIVNGFCVKELSGNITIPGHFLYHLVKNLKD